MMEQIWIRVSVFLLLFIYTISDLRKRMIWWPLAMLVGAAGIIMNCRAGGSDPGVCLAGAAPAAVLTAAAFLTREAIGFGDCLVIAVCGAMLGPETVLELLLLAFALAALWGILLLAGGRGDRNTKFAFMPFLLAAYTGMLLL